MGYRPYRCNVFQDFLKNNSIPIYHLLYPSLIWHNKFKIKGIVNIYSILLFLVEKTHTHRENPDFINNIFFFCQIQILGSRTGSKFCSSSAMLLFNKVPEIAVPPGLAVMRSALEVFPPKMLSHAGKRYCWWKKSG